MMTDALAAAALRAALLAPIVALALAVTTPRRLSWAGLAVALWAAHEAARASGFGVFGAAPLGWDWLGAIAGLAVAVVAVLVVTLRGGDAGLGARLQPGWRGGLGVAGLLVLVAVAAAWVLPGGASSGFAPDAAGLVYHVVLIAVGEELFFRGALQGALDRAVPPPAWARARLGGPIGWGGVIGAAAYAVFTGVSVSAGAVFALKAVVAGAFVVGLALAWVRARTGSVWPCVIAHALAGAAILAL